MKNFFRALNQIWQKVPTRAYSYIFGAFTVVLIFGLFLLNPDDDTAPCSRTQYFGGCYEIPRSLCETTLSLIKKSCESRLKEITKPGQLVGPIQRNCEQVKFDRILKYTRRSDTACTDRISYLENWLKTNPDF